MGNEQAQKTLRRAVRRTIGEDSAVLALEAYRVLCMRGFWGRLKWLLFGR